MIISLEKLKAILGITGEEQDTKLTALIELAESDYLAIRNRPFDIVDGKTVYPDGAEATALEMIRYHLSDREAGVISETVSRRSVTYEQAMNGYPRPITKRIKRYLSFD